MARLNGPLAALAVSLALVPAACGGGDSGSDGSGAERGRPNASASAEAQIFSDTCGGCHTFAPAGTNGAVGPPLDSTTLGAGEISEQIAQGASGMPPDLLEGEERERVARWIAEQAG